MKRSSFHRVSYRSAGALVLLASALLAGPPLVDTGTMDYWDGNLPAKFIYVAAAPTAPNVDTGTLDYLEDSGLPAGYIYKSYRGAAPATIGWYSVRTHTNIGEIAIELTSSPTVSETRRGGVQQLEIDFTLDIAAQGGGAPNASNFAVAVTGVGNVTPSAAAIVGGKTLRLSFANGALGDRKTCSLSLTGKLQGATSGLPVEGTLSMSWRNYEGDINNSGGLSLADVAAVKGQNRQPVTPDNAKFDLNNDGRINLIDAAMARALVD